MKNKTLDYTYKIAVILPVYNGMQYLQESVNSVLNQTYTNFEFLICDDNSTDKSYSYLKSLSDSRITLLKNKHNLGLFPTLNRLIKASSSELIHLWAQDDIMYKNCLEETIKFHNKFPDISFSFSRWHTINEKGEITGKVFECDDQLLNSEGHTISSILYGSIAGNIANVTVIKKEVERVGYFNKEMKYCGDFDMWYKLGKDKPIGLSGKYLIKMRNHSGQLSKNLEASLYRLKENLQIYQNFVSILAANKQKIAQRALKWKIYPQYFNQLLFIVSKRKLNLAKKYAKALRKYDGIFILGFRWTLIKLFRIVKFEQKFYDKIFISKF